MKDRREFDSIDSDTSVARLVEVSKEMGMAPVVEIDGEYVPPQPKNVYIRKGYYRYSRETVPERYYVELTEEDWLFMETHQHKFKYEGFGFLNEYLLKTTYLFLDLEYDRSALRDLERVFRS